MLKYVIKIFTIFPAFLRVPLSKKIVDVIIKKYARIKIEGFQNLANVNFPVVFISNHLSNSDGLILNEVLKSCGVTFVAGEKLSKDSYTQIGLDCVNTITIKPNSIQKESITKIIDAVKSGTNICMFPEGTRSRVGSMIEGKKGIILIAKLSKVPIVPIGIWGTEKLMAINKDDKMSSEWFTPSDVHVNIGEPFTIEKDHDINYIMQKISTLLPDTYRGVYK